jgi:YidC/Oxa1 family membrane protein insertase
MSKNYPQPSPAPVNNTVTPPQAETIVENKPQADVAPEIDLPSGNDYVFENKLYTTTFTDVGGAVKKITLNKNPGVGLNVPYNIFSSARPQDSLFSFMPEGSGLKLNSVKYDAKRSENEIIFTHSFSDGVILEKKFTIHNSLYSIELEIKFTNTNGKDSQRDYALISSMHFPASAMDERFIEVSANIDGKVYKNKKAGKPYLVTRNGALNWIMLKNRYTSMISRPFSRVNKYVFQQYPNGTIISAMDTGDFVIPGNSSIIHKYGSYIGPSNLELAKKTNIGIESALQYGFLGSIGQILMDTLRFLHKVTKNWGISIILLTILINIVLFPLSKKSYKSMHEMQMLQPKIEKLRQECKNNAQKLQKETMELYKKYKINPMGGCLPLILQMPIFFALYQGLVNFIDLRGAGFLWIRDLSETESIRIPIELPLIGNTINILPILMVIMTFVQQKLTSKFTTMAQTDDQRKQQKFMMIFMTIMFGFIFYNLPSGFVLYWLVSTIIMTFIQSILTKGPKTLEANA